MVPSQREPAEGSTQSNVNDASKGRTVAISARIPLARFLKVGGKSESIAKLIDWPEVAAPSTVITKRFAVELGVVVGEKLTVTCFQVV